MSSFQSPIPRDNYCKKHGPYSGYVCPDCALEREKEGKMRVCPFCHQPRVISVKYMYCTNCNCVQYLIMFTKT